MRRGLICFVLTGVFVFGLTVLSHPPRQRSSAEDTCSNEPANPMNLVREIGALIKKGRTEKMAKLISQLSRKQCRLKLPAVPAAKLDGVQLYRQGSESVVLVGAQYKCKKCPRWHVSVATGFAIAASGVVVTNYHVVNKPGGAGMAIMTRAGKVHGVGEVLAANKDADVAILKTTATDLVPLPLQVGAPVGTPIHVISHPSKMTYMLTEGIIARRHDHRTKSGNIEMLAITADFAKGSSGGPVLSERGAAVGMVASTRSIYYEKKNGVETKLQMVIKNCVCAESILACISR